MSLRSGRDHTVECEEYTKSRSYIADSQTYPNGQTNTHLAQVFKDYLNLPVCLTALGYMAHFMMSLSICKNVNPILLGRL